MLSFYIFKIILYFFLIDKGREWLADNWKLCQPLKNSSDVQQLMSYLEDIYINLAVVNYPYEANFLTPLPAYPVKVSISIYN